LLIQKACNTDEPDTGKKPVNFRNYGIPFLFYSTHTAVVPAKLAIGVLLANCQERKVVGTFNSLILW